MTATSTERVAMPRPHDPDVASLLRRVSTLLKTDGHHLIAAEVATLAAELANHPAIDGKLEQRIDQAVSGFQFRRAIQAVLEAHDQAGLLQSVQTRIAERAMVRQVILAADAPPQ